MRRVLCVALTFLFGIPQANAWGTRGHELVAYLAYMNLDPQVRLMVDALVQLNPCIVRWTSQVSAIPAPDRPVALFMLAATWPDRIKPPQPGKPAYACNAPATGCPSTIVFSTKDGAIGPTGHFSADIPPKVDEQNPKPGYLDDRRHQYWHFADNPISGDGTPTQAVSGATVATELPRLAHALGTDQDKCLRSYDLVWLEHLVGDIHQPLHDVQRYTRATPNGDQGGNAITICDSQGKCGSKLHGYWDSLPGSEGSLPAVMTQGCGLNRPAPPADPAIDIDHPEKWMADASGLAASDAYAAPFNGSSTKVNASDISPGYRTKAVADMNMQITIAGYRLATLLNYTLGGAAVTLQHAADNHCTP